MDGTETLNREAELLLATLLRLFLLMPDPDRQPPRLRRGDPLHIVGFYSAKLGCWVAQPVEIRYRGKGASFEEALQELKKTLSEEPLREMILGGPSAPEYAFLYYGSLLVGPIPDVVTEEIRYPGESDYYHFMVHHWIDAGHPG